MKVQVHSSLEQPLEYNQDHDATDKSRLVMTFVTILGVTKILCSFGLVFEEKTVKKIPESSRLQFLEKFLAIFCSTDAEDNTSGPLNRGGIADLSLFRTLLAIHQKCREPSFWELTELTDFLSIGSF